MEWHLALLLIIGGFFIIMLTGMPIAFCFILLNVIAAFLFWGGPLGVEQLVISMADSLTKFTLLPLPLFCLMGEVLFYSGVGPKMLDALDRCLGRLPGRLSLLAVGGGTVFSTLTGASMGSIALLGTTLVPEMKQRGYKNSMTLGPIMAAGGLAIMIPPSGLAVLLGAIGSISVGPILIAIIIPGLMLAVLYAAYIIARCRLQPSIAPSYDVSPAPLLEKLTGLARYVLPAAFVIFLVTGIMFLGVATPTEAAATGASATFILAAFYGKLNWEVAKKSIAGAFRVTVMLFMIICGATAFSQNLAYTGASRGLVEFTASLAVTPIFVIITMQVVLLLLGMFMDAASMMMLTLPLFVPIVLNLGFNPIWFAVVYLLNAEVALISPPFGLSLFVMKSVAPADATMGDVYRAALPFIYIDIAAIILIMAFPAVALWLPSLMG